MKKLCSIVLILATVLLPLCSGAAAAGSGTVYYVDSENGNDANSGKTESQPWKTLAMASSVTYAPGDRILLKAGCVFNGVFTAKGSGTKDAPIVLGAYGDTAYLGKPIIRSGEEKANLVYLRNLSGWTIENIEFTAPDGNCGIYVSAVEGTVVTDITVKDCDFHDIWNKPRPDHNGAYCPILLKATDRGSKICRVHLQDCDIYDCAFGIKTGGSNREMNPDHFISPEESYNSDFLFENIRLHNILHDGIILCAINGAVIRNCALINTSIRDDFYCAPLWSHHTCHSLIENCEIAGATNEKDGMAIDFDGWTTDATYQYIYSHDNVRFINSCCCDNYTKNANCTVRYCLSVNDNKQPNRMANLISVKSVDYAAEEAPVCMDGFRFYNNTLINCSDISCATLTNSVIVNNIFVGEGVGTAVTDMRKNVGENGNFITKFDGIFTNNCFWNIGLPDSAKNSLICDPQFTGSDATDAGSYMLKEKSPLLGKGIRAESDMGEHDFYGNALTDVHNIGCYEGTGEKVSATDSIFSAIARSRSVVFRLKTLFSTIIGRMKSILDTFWLF